MKFALQLYVRWQSHAHFTFAKQTFHSLCEFHLPKQISLTPLASCPVSADLLIPINGGCAFLKIHALDYSVATILFLNGNHGVLL